MQILGGEAQTFGGGGGAEVLTLRSPLDETLVTIHSYYNYSHVWAVILSLCCNVPAKHLFIKS